MQWDMIALAILLAYLVLGLLFGWVMLAFVHAQSALFRKPASMTERQWRWVVRMVSLRLMLRWTCGWLPIVLSYWWRLPGGWK